MLGSAVSCTDRSSEAIAQGSRRLAPDSQRLGRTPRAVAPKRKRSVRRRDARGEPPQWLRVAAAPRSATELAGRSTTMAAVAQLTRGRLFARISSAASTLSRRSASAWAQQSHAWTPTRAPSQILGRHEKGWYHSAAKRCQKEIHLPGMVADSRKHGCRHSSHCCAQPQCWRGANKSEWLAITSQRKPVCAEKGCRTGSWQSREGTATKPHPGSERSREPQGPLDGGHESFACWGPLGP